MGHGGPVKFATHHLRTITALKDSRGPSARRYEAADEVLTKLHLTTHGVSVEGLPEYVGKLSDDDLVAALKAADVVERYARDGRACSLYLHLTGTCEYVWKSPTEYHRHDLAVLRALTAEGERRMATAKALISAIRKASR